MASPPDNRALRDAIARLEASGVVPGVGAALAAVAGGYPGELRRAVVEAVPAFTESGNPDVLPELEQDMSLHVAEVCRLLGGGLPGELEFVRAHAERRAGQKFPLDALLQSYRCLHRQLSAWVREAALAAADEQAQLRRVVAAVADFAFEYTGNVATLITSEYVHHTRRLAEVEGDRRAELLNTLLDGYDESDQAAARLLRRAGYLEQRQSYCVAVARSVDPREMENLPRAQRMADAVNEVLAPLPLRSIIGIRDNRVVAILSATRRLSGWTAPQSLVADRVYPALLKVGPAALIGLSRDAPSTSHIPRAAREARLALDFASVAKRVLPYAEISFRQMLLAQAQETAAAALPAWAESFADADRRARGKLSASLRAYADCNMNVQQTAKQLGMHPNSIYARLQKIEKLTGLNALSYHDLSEMLLVLDCGAGQR